jgi:hypothetical protein
VTTEMDWLEAFPIRPATEAVEALCESWHFLTRVPRPGFHAGKREPELTRALKAHVECVTARNRGLLGMWATEAVINEIDLETAELKEERRTDIVYGWNDATAGIQLVFEFKKVNRHTRSRQQYLGANGLGRFVTGIYSCRQPVAAMVGVLTDPEEMVVPALLKALSNKATASALKLRARASGAAYDRPSLLFPAADFDTEHDRPRELAPSHGSIRVAHIFLAFKQPDTSPILQAQVEHRT